MKLFELFQITELSGSELRQIRNLETIPSPGDLQQLLIDQGMELIASGSYSQVYGHSGSSWVVKVIGQPLNMSNENERCGVQWLRYCNKNWNTNTHHACSIRQNYQALQCKIGFTRAYLCGCVGEIGAHLRK